MGGGGELKGRYFQVLQQEKGRAMSKGTKTEEDIYTGNPQSRPSRAISELKKTPHPAKRGTA